MIARYNCDEACVCLAYECVYHSQLSMMMSFDVIAFIVQHVMTQNPACSSHRQCSVAAGFFFVFFVPFVFGAGSLDADV